MKKAIGITLGAFALLTLGACASEPDTLPPGEYSRTERSVSPSGTETEKKTSTSVYYDADGNKRAVQETETTRDPEGLFNKSTTRSVKSYN